MKKLLFSFILTAVLALSMLCGCYSSAGGVDGRDGQDLSIYELYEAANAAREEEGLEQLSFLDFLSEYLHYDFTYSEEDSAQSIMNRSLMSCVAILCGFKYNSGGWSISTKTQYYVGSGVIVELDKSAGDAYILTNCHVVYDDESINSYAQEIYIYLYGNDDITDSSNPLPAKIVGASSTYDLALLKIENSSVIKNSEVAAASFSQNEEVYVGENVYAIGNPEGAGISLTRGIICRESETISINLSSVYADNDKYANDYRVIRTDAAVNGGNSGGGLFGSDGKLVGIINSKVVSDEIDNMGYALAGSYVKRIWPLMRDGYSSRTDNFGLRRAILPVAYSYTSSSYFDNEKNLAVIVDKVCATESSGGIQNGDIFKNVRIEDKEGQVVEDMPITRYFNLSDVLLSARDDYKIIYTVLRDGKEEKIETSPTFASCK